MPNSGPIVYFLLIGCCSSGLSKAILAQGRPFASLGRDTWGGQGSEGGEIIDKVINARQIFLNIGEETNDYLLSFSAHIKKLILIN